MGMTRQEREVLDGIVEQLNDIRDQSPSVSIYTQGRVQGSIQLQISEVLVKLADLLDKHPVGE